MKLRITLCLVVSFLFAALAFAQPSDVRVTDSSQAPSATEEAVLEESSRTNLETSPGEITFPVELTFKHSPPGCMCDPTAPDNGASDCEAYGCEDGHAGCPPRSEWCQPDPFMGPDCGLCNC